MAEGSVSGLRVLVSACEAFNVYLSDGKSHGCCQNYGSFWGPYYHTAPNI